MKLGTLVIGVALVLGTAGFAGAVNCKQVNKYLGTGRSVSDVAQTMVIDEADVKKCQEEAAAAGGAAGGANAAKPAGEAAKDVPK